jgi:hypothetical protein
VDKDRLLAALNAIQNKEAGCFQDELETLITLVVNVSDDEIKTAWEDFSTDTE